jgi:SAM-dependent methyltransferase
MNNEAFNLRMTAKPTHGFAGTVRNLLDWARRALLPSHRFLYQRDAVALPPLELRAAGPIFRKDRAFRAFAVSDIATMERHLKLAGKSVLDFGCGAGRLYFGFTAHNEPRSYLGVDVRADVIAWAQAHITAANRRFSFIRADVHNERYNPQGALSNEGWRTALRSEFDVVYCYSVLSHLTEQDASMVIDVFARCTTPGSLIFLTAFVGDQLQPIVVNPDDAGISIRGPLHVVRYRRDYFRDTMLRPFEIVAEYPEAATDRQTLYVLRPRAG